MSNVISTQSRRFTVADKQPLLEYPQFTRPEVYRGLRVPEVLLSGNHGEIKKYRDSAALEETRRLRPDMLKNSGETEWFSLNGV